MRIKYLKNHGTFKAGEEKEDGAAAATYLIRVGVAEEIAEAKEYVEKLEVELPKASFKEKRENKKGNVPTAKKVKK